MSWWHWVGVIVGAWVGLWLVGIGLALLIGALVGQACRRRGHVWRTVADDLRICRRCQSANLAPVELVA